MINAIKLEMHKHQPETNVSNNFAVALPEAQAAYANEVFKNSYCMGFLGVTEPLLELELERRLVEKVKQFLLELGQGFTYIGNQHVLSYDGKDYKVDMLFFHRGLRSLVAEAGDPALTLPAASADFHAVPRDPAVPSIGAYQFVMPEEE